MVFSSAVAPSSSPACRACGCTDERACEGGCWWALPGLCSRCATPTQREDAQRAALAELFARGDAYGTDVPLSLVDIYMLVMACQLTLTHPGVEPHVAARIADLGRHLQEAVEWNGPLGELVERGWNRDEDVPTRPVIYLPDGSVAPRAG